MAQWAPLPARQPGEALSLIDYDGSKTEQSCSFRHRDSRIWHARIVNQPKEWNDETYPYVITLTSTGCRACHFLSMRMDQAKRTAGRFANMSLAMYRRLVVDAAGSTEFPVEGHIGVFRMQLVSQRARSRARQQLMTGNTNDLVTSEVTGIGRHTDQSIEVFPQSQELRDILGSVCQSDTIAIVRNGINEIRADVSSAGFLTGSRDRIFDGVSTPEIVDDELVRTLANLQSHTEPDDTFNNSFYTASSRQRVIQLDDEDE